MKKWKEKKHLYVVSYWKLPTLLVNLQDIVVGLMTQEAANSSETTGQSSELNNIGKL